MVEAIIMKFSFISDTRLDFVRITGRFCKYRTLKIALRVLKPES
jgi:hypothetical protein